MLFSDAQRAIPGFLLITTLVAVYIGLSPARADDWVINPLTGITALAFCLLAFARIALGVPNRVAKRIWVGLIGVFCTVAAAQFIEPYSHALQQSFGIDDVADCVLLIVSPITLWMIAKFDPPPIMARNLFLFGFLMQSVATILDILNASLELHGHQNVAAIDVITDFGQFAALQVYLIGVAVFLLSLRYHRLARAAGVKKLGELSRYLLVRLNLANRAGGSSQRERRPGYGAGLWWARLINWLPIAARQIRDQQDRAIRWQVTDIFCLGWRQGLDASAYYRFGLYHRLKYNRAGGYLTNSETSNGLFGAIDHLLAKQACEQAPDFSDRLSLATFCEAQDLPHLPTLLAAENGRLDYTSVISPEMLGRDLLAVPRFTGKDDRWGRSTQIMPFSGRGRFSQLAAGAWLILQKPDCPSDLSAMAGDALAVVRVVTCRTKNGDIDATHGLLRLVRRGKSGRKRGAESDQMLAGISALAAPVDMMDGQIGEAVVDQPRRVLERYVRHPETDSPIAGLTVPRWSDIKALACKAHDRCPGRFVIGWDIVYRDDGIAILGATASPDVELLQSAYEQPIGDSLLAQPILDFLQILNAVPQPGQHQLDAKLTRTHI
ncbi:sugar-transfer associated ATP-grasp domain-containing protein [Dongia soli]|uniref:Sugar-transfer associated ATP-grasp domain-containing protein n=1 Tax=Dongia soli TaxID=600628 RepID=A0ABU5E9T7_9PROT|nr:sugar-transfer associated ATP-grasp domain-containing protein [Dongia soli]MDY0882667.1 sugar-transfer associated ATP-grasp domain-containing protein [Dongia soli]